MPLGRLRRAHRVSLQTEILVGLSVVATGALLFAMLTVLLFQDDLGSRNGWLLLALLILADVVVFVGFSALKLRSLVLRPLDEAVRTAEDIAGGDLSRRVPESAVAEFNRLATSLNHMTARLLEEQALVARFEKMAGVGRLAAGVAHEIGNPLGAINGYIHLLRRRAAGDPQLEDTLAGIEHESTRIDRIMRGMLEYARPRRRSTVWLDVNDCVRRVGTLLHDQGALRGVTLELALAPRLTPIAGDPHEMDQVLVNVLLNAVDATDQRGTIHIVTRERPFDVSLIAPDAGRAGDDPDAAIAHEPSARLRAWLATVGEPAAVIEIVVADSGPGVAWSDRERIFDPFFTTKEAGKGTGLGLAIVARVVESLGGTVWVRDAREGGAAFVMLLPVPASPRSPSAH